MFLFLVVSVVTFVVGVADLLSNGFSWLTFSVVVFSLLLSWFFYKLIKDEDGEWGCD